MTAMGERCKNGSERFDAPHGVKHHVLRDGVGDMRHIRPGGGLDQRVVQRGLFQRHAHLGERHRRTQRNEEGAKLARLVELAVHRELKMSNSEDVGPTSAP